MNLELLKQLTEAHGIAGREERVREIVVAALRPLVDELRVDALGNVIGHRRGHGQQRALITAHMDEIGFFVKHIDDKGFLRVLPVGFWDARQMMAQRCVVHGRKDLDGIFVSTKPMQLYIEEGAKHVPQVGDFAIDLGLSADEVREWVEVGDWVTMRQELNAIGHLLSCKAMDDRVGVYVMLEALRQVRAHQADLFIVATVQEEVGLRGATTAAFGVAPTVGLALDITPAVDTPGVLDHQHISRLGAGAAIKVMDSSTIPNQRLLAFCRTLAQQRNIQYQLEVLSRGGTDAGAIQHAHGGVPVIALSTPTRYTHSTVETIHANDLQAGVELTRAWLEEIHQFV